MTKTLRRAGLSVILCTILLALIAEVAPAAKIRIGSVREQTIQWLMESKKLSRAAAEQMIKVYARRNRAEIIDDTDVPDGAIADFVTIDPTKAGREQVRYEGCAMLFSPSSEYGRKLWAEIEKMRGTPAYEYFMRRFQEAVARGFFVHELTPEQKNRLLNADTRSGRFRPEGATQVRILVASFRTPPWSDRASSPSYISHGHPIHPPIPPTNPTEAERIATTGMTPGGGWSNGQRAGLNSPAWNETHRGHDDPVNGADSFVYRLRPDFIERWFNFLFDYSNPNSVANFYRAESHGNLAISGDRGDIAAWLDSHHILDVNPFGQSRDWTPMPGTPIIRDITGGPYIARASVETGQFSVLFRDHWTVTNMMGGAAAGANLSNYRLTVPGGTPPDTPPYTPTAGTAVRDNYDTRHVTFTGVTWSYWDAGASPPQWRTKTINNDTNFTLTYLPTGDTVSGIVGRGCPELPNTTVTAGEASTWLLQSRPFNRFMSICYYTHDHDFGGPLGSTKSNRPYQLSHVRNSRGYVDDIMGTDQSDLNYHVDRPRPYDHDAWDDANLPTGGYFGTTPGHSTGAWIGACNQVMADWGISTAGYNKVIYVYPYGDAVQKGAHIFIPMASVGGSTLVLPESAGLALAGHELGHTFGMVDLYDLDFYTNNNPPPPSPPYFESDATGPYSIMANGGIRVDPWHKIALGWLVPTLLATGSPLVPQDRENAPIPEIEGTLQNPVVYKALPELATGISTGGAEYFLVENRNRTGANYFGDPSPRGLYIWHIDGRFGHVDEVYFSVIPEQADGLYQLERQPRGWNVANPDAMAGDPFPGSFNLREFTQWTNPNSRAHGTPAGRGQIVPGSAHDSFFRVDAISDPGATMRANLWVQPREVIATLVDVAPATAQQGETNVPVLGIHLNNDDTAPNISQGDVVIRRILVDESGNSKRDADVARALVYEDINHDGAITPGTDVLLDTTTVVNQQAEFANLSFRVPLATERDLIIAYDIAENAQSAPQVTVGAGIDHADPSYDPSNPRSAITCQIPGGVQERVRPLGAYRFPIRTPANKIVILEAPDTLTITPTATAPTSVLQGTQDVGMLALRLSVDRDDVVLEGLRVDSTGTSTRPGDVSAKLYDDANLNAVIDPGESVIDTTNFAVVGSKMTALFDDLGGYTVDSSTERGLIVAYDFASDATVGATVNSRMENTTYVTLRDPLDVVAPDNFPMNSQDTLIVADTTPTLRALDGGTRNWLSPVTGTPTTQFTWTAVYTDVENDPPNPIQVFVDGTPYTMVPTNPVDTNYTDGATFRHRMTLPVGNHTYYMFASDGNTSVRYPTPAPNTYPEPIVVNTPPTLANGRVTPSRGDDTTTFLYEIDYFDADDHPAAWVRVMIDGGGYLPMTADPADVDPPSAGITYQLTLPAGILTPGAHKATFQANDGYDTVTWPTTGAMSGPIVSAASAGFFADSAFNVQVDPYEENNPIFVQITDIDQNIDVNVRDTITATVRVLTGGDIETITLRETQKDSGIFRTLSSGVSTLGRAGASGDGLINVISGPTGNTLRLTYVDPLDANDRQTLTATVIDTVAPEKIAIGELLAAADPDGSTVTVDFTAYDEAAQIDVARYDVFYEPTNTQPITALTPVASLSPGTQTLQIPTGGPGPDMYVAVAVYDEVPNVRPAVRWRKVSTADTNPPTLLGQNPADGSTEVPLDTAILFQLDDPGSGIAASDIRVRIQQDPADGGGWTDVTASLQIGPDPHHRVVTYDPPVDFLYNQRVTVEVTAQDVAGNGMTQTFSFLTASDVEAPKIQNQVPADGDVDVPIDTTISFELTDNRAGIDPSTIRVTVNGTNVTQKLQIDTTDPLLVSVLFDRVADFAYGETVTVTVEASDIAGNAMTKVVYSFTTLPDTEGVVIDQLTPPDGATDVLIDTDISFRIYDTVSGVDRDSIELLINDVPIVLTDANLKQISPTSYLVTYDPPADFPYSTRIKVQAKGKDNAGNARRQATWHFTTEPPPTFSIMGRIEETQPNDTASAKVGVAGVQVRVTNYATGQLETIVTTAGTGVFEVTGLLDGSYVVEPTLTDYTFVSRKTGKSTQRVYVGLKDTDGDGNPQLDASGVDFDATRILYAIKGQVLEGGQPLADVQVTDGTRTATTNAQGKYTIQDVPSGTYTVTPSRTNYTFNPTSQVVVVASANATGIDFTAQAATFAVSGTVQDAEGNRLSGVKVSVKGGTSVAVTSAAGQYTLTGVKAGIQTIVATREGYVMEPAPGVTVENILISGNLTGIDFIGYQKLSRLFSAGTHFIGVPTTPRTTNAREVFGTRLVARWAATEVPPRYVTPASDPDHDVLAVQPGRGYFVKFGQKTTLEVPGIPVSVNEPYIFTLDQDWTMAANPFPSALAFANLVPANPNVVAPYGFVYENGRYVIVSNIAEISKRRWIDAWEGVWLLSDIQGVSITARPPAAGSATADQRENVRTVDAANWQIPIVARAAGTEDSCSAVGISASKGDLVVLNPPPLPQSVDVVLRGKGGEALAIDLRKGLGNGVTWEFAVRVDMANIDVELSLPDLSEVPEDLMVTLVDVATGKRLYARTMPIYVYSSGQGGERQFKLEVAPRISSGLVIHTAGAQVKGNVASISYVLSADAEVSARVLNLAGRVVRTLTRGSAVGSGANALTWDLKSEAGTVVPAGNYLVEIQAVTPDGQRATAMQTIAVNR
ncbi:MAG: carboxypeptidase regulatory-like domain-containing protein [Candidatus Zipacnadales bacterium]